MVIVFDEASLEQRDNASRSITGVIYFDFTGVAFPEQRWRDFPAVIVAWWLDELEDMERGSLDEVVLRFMDGPYWIALARKNGNDVELSCIEDREDAGTVYEGCIPLSEFGFAVRQVARQIERVCIRQNFASRDVDALRERLGRIDMG